MASNPPSPKHLQADVGTSGSNEELESGFEELEKLELEVKQMAGKILEFRATLPAQLNTTLVSLLSAQRLLFPNLDPTSDPGPSTDSNEAIASQLYIICYTRQKDLPIEKHPVVKSLVEIRMFREKIRSIDKKHEYQIQKLTRDSGRATELVSLKEKETENPLAFRPNPDGLIRKLGPTSKDEVYHPPKFVPAFMKEDKTPKQERDALRRRTEIVRKSSLGYVKELLNDIEGRPEEVKDHYGTDSVEYQRYKRKWDERNRHEEENFIRVDRTKADKRKQKQLEKSRNGLRGLTDDFFDEINTLPLGDDSSELPTNFVAGNRGVRKFKNRKRRH